MKALRNIGRPIIEAASKERMTWKCVSGQYLVDLSGGPLVQSLLNVSIPPSALFANIGPPGGLDTINRSRLEHQIHVRAGKRCGGVLWASSGSDAIELSLWAADLKAKAINKSGLKRLVVRNGSYHGSTAYTRALSTRSGVQKNGFLGSFEVIVCDETREGNCKNSAAGSILDELKLYDAGPETVLILESVATTGWHYWPGINFYKSLLEWCRDHQITVIIDEVAAGCYRHGWFSSWQWDEGQYPDVVALGKGLTCGLYPLSCAIFTQEIADIISSQGARPPLFTHSLNDVSAWIAEHCLEKYDSLLSDGYFKWRSKLIEELACSIIPSMSDNVVEYTSTSLRIKVDQYKAAKIRSRLADAGLLVYEAKSEFGGKMHSFFHVCPPFDVERVIAANYIASFCELVTSCA